MNRKTLWMRYVDFGLIKNILHLVNENNGRLRAKDLEELGIIKGFFIKKENSQPFTHSTLYHYRKVMENLNLLKVEQRLYFISDEEKVTRLLQITSYEKDLSENAKELFRNLVIDNNDCKAYFFNLMVNKAEYDLEELRQNGNYFSVETKSMRENPINDLEKNTMNKLPSKRKLGPVIFRNPSGEEIHLKTTDEINAVFWGLRLWALDLEITNEIMTDFDKGRMIYPVNPYVKDENLYRILLEMASTDGNSEWRILHIPTFIKVASMTKRFPIKSIKIFIRNLKILYPADIMFIPTSTVFIDSRTPFKKQDQTLRNSYFYDEHKGYISHLRVSIKLLREIPL